MNRLEYVMERMSVAKSYKEKRRKEILGILEKPMPTIVLKEVEVENEESGDKEKE